MSLVTPAPLPAQLPPLTDSSDALDDVGELRRRADADGYLFFRGLLPADAVTDVRDDVYSVLEADRILVPGDPGVVDRDAVDAIPADQLRMDIGIPHESYVRVQQVQPLHRLPHHPNLVGLYERLLGTEIFVHPRHIVRAMTGHPALRPTPPHQDFPLVQGTTQTWTAWFPLDVAPIERGPLAVLRGSHHNGYLPISVAEGAGQIQAQLCTEDDWVGSAFEPGDVLTFTSLTVHRAIPATARDKIRLSMDVRYQAADQPIEERALRNHAQVEWDEIYRGWDTDDVQFYWSSSTPRLSPWDDRLMQPSQRIC